MHLSTMANWTIFPLSFFTLRSFLFRSHKFYTFLRRPCQDFRATPRKRSSRQLAANFCPNGRMKCQANKATRPRNNDDENKAVFSTFAKVIRGGDKTGLYFCLSPSQTFIKNHRSWRSHKNAPCFYALLIIPSSLFGSFIPCRLLSIFGLLEKCGMYERIPKRKATVLGSWWGPHELFMSKYWCQSCQPKTQLVACLQAKGSKGPDHSSSRKTVIIRNVCPRSSKFFY